MQRYTENQAYQDGRTDARNFARTHTPEERAETSRRYAILLRDIDDTHDVMRFYYIGYCEILDSWIDGQGA